MLWQVVAGSRMRERRMSGSERGQGPIVVGHGGVNSGWGASLTNTRGASGGSPARPAKKRIHTTPTAHERPCPTRPDGGPLTSDRRPSQLNPVFAGPLADME